MTVPVTTFNLTSGQNSNFGASILRQFRGTVIHCLTDFVNGRTTIQTITTNDLDNNRQQDKLDNNEENIIYNFGTCDNILSWFRFQNINNNNK